MTELSKMLEEYRAGERELPTYDELAALPRVFQSAEQNEQLARDAQAVLDAEMMGVGFLVDGVSVHPSRVTVLLPTAAPQVVADERQAFESWIGLNEKMGPQAERYEDTYTDNYVGEMWESWQARASLQAAPVQAQEPVAYALTPEEIVTIDDQVLNKGLRGPDGKRQGYCVLFAQAAIAANNAKRSPVQPVAVPDGDEAFKIVSQGCYFGNGDVARAAKEWFKAGYKAAPKAQGDANEVQLPELPEANLKRGPGLTPHYTAKQMKEYARAAIAAKAAS